MFEISLLRCMDNPLMPIKIISTSSNHKVMKKQKQANSIPKQNVLNSQATIS